MGCAKQGKKPDKECKEDFNDCSMIAMGMAPLSTTTESTTPELPDFLKPTVKPTIRPLRPINDIDLPDGSFVIQPGKEEEPETEEDKEFMQCLIELYKCQEKGHSDCPQARG